MKKFFIVALSLICIICAGCVQINFDLIITDSGEVVRKWKCIGTVPFLQQIETAKIKNEKLFPDLKVKTIVEGDMRGYEFTLNYPDIESFARASSEFYSVNPEKNKGISRHKGWFFDEYDFDFYIKCPPANSYLISATVDQAMFSKVIYENVITLPYPAVNHDADEVSADGKVLKWNLAPILVYGGERHMNARFKLWHKDKIALTAIAELLLFAATIFFFIKARADDLEGVGKDLRFKRNIFAILFVALGAISAYLIFTPVVFTEADIISIAAP